MTSSAGIMLTRELIDLRQAPTLAWRNGAGTRTELAAHPVGSGENFDWRIGIASMTKDADFSSFPGIDRSITLLRGAGFTMISPIGHVIHELSALFKPCYFSGDLPIKGHLIAGPCEVFNLNVRRGYAKASLGVCDESWCEQASGVTMLFSVDAHTTVRVMDDAEVRLEPGVAVLWRDGAPAMQVVSDAPGGTVFRVRITLDSA